MLRRTFVLISISRALPCVLALLALAGPPLAAAQQPTRQSARPPPTPTLHWSSCPEIPDAECAGLAVPIDPSRPGRAQLTLRIARVRAADPTRKKGVLLLIPGGPGAGIGEMIAGDMRAAQHIDEFRRDYDVVTFDPRGIGQSSPILCAPDAVPPPAPPRERPPSSVGFKEIAAANAAFFQTCFAATGALMSHLSAVDTAADIERIRQALTPNEGLRAYAPPTAASMRKPISSATARTSERSCSTAWSITASTW